jgi:U3 small nucleolar RNA-associated protein 14
MARKWPRARVKSAQHERKAPLTDERRLQRKIDKQHETEARWLQKMLFALSKAREAREKLAETSGEELNPLITLDDGTQISLDGLEDVVTKRVEYLMGSLGRSVYGRGS